MRDFTHSASPDSAQVTPRLEAACAYVSSGISLVPIERDGSKATARTLGSWRPYQDRLPTLAELQQWFGGLRPYGIAGITGTISRNLEDIDVDNAAVWPEFYPRACAAVSAIASAPVIQTPRPGYALLVRCEAPVPASHVLAYCSDPERPGRWKALIETRGAHAYFLMPGSPAECHPSGRLYRFILGSIADIPVLTEDELYQLHSVAAGFNQRPPEEPRQRTWNRGGSDAGRPGDSFNQRGDWASILVPFGWVFVGNRGGVGLWRRPGKQRGISATVGYGDSDLFHLFSSSASPFEQGRSYSKFSAFTLLRHGGDYAAAARALRRWGFRR